MGENQCHVVSQQKLPMEEIAIESVYSINRQQ